MMKYNLLSLLIFLSSSIFAACSPPERFDALENPIPTSDLPPVFQENLTSTMQIVNFWALWCAPCRAELPLLKEISHTGAPVLLVNIDDDQAAVLQFLTKIQVQDLPQIQLENSDFLQMFGITGFPATFLIEHGALRYRTQGALKPADQEALRSYAACVFQS